MAFENGVEDDEDKEEDLLLEFLKVVAFVLETAAAAIVAVERMRPLRKDRNLVANLLEFVVGFDELVDVEDILFFYCQLLCCVACVSSL